MRREAALLSSCIMVARSATPRPALCTFDCTGTLFEPTKTVGALYKSAIVAEGWKAGLAAAVAAEALDEDLLSSTFAAAYGAADAARPCFGAGLCTSAEWWRPVVETTIINAAGATMAAELEPLLPGAFESLFHETFVSRAGWQLRPHAAAALENIGKSDVMLGVVSNWDDRLPLLLKRLGVAHHFDFFLTSREACVEKPSAAIFGRARELAGVAAGVRCVHVGDSFSRDVEGAAAAGEGWEAVHICTEDERGRMTPERLGSVKHAHLTSLAALPALLGVS